MALFSRFSDHSDEQLMSRFQAGDKAALSVLYQRYSKRLLHFSYRMLNGDQAMAQDVLHDVFLVLVERPERFDARRVFKPWIFMVCANACRRRHREPSMSDVEGVFLATDHPLDDLARTLDQPRFKAQLRAVLATFSYEHRCTFILRYQEDLSVREIAEVMECQEGTVKSRIHYTIKRLAEQLAVFNPAGPQT